MLVCGVCGVVCGVLRGVRVLDVSIWGVVCGVGYGVLVCVL